MTEKEKALLLWQAVNRFANEIYTLAGESMESDTETDGIINDIFHAFHDVDGYYNQTLALADSFGIDTEE